MKEDFMKKIFEKNGILISDLQEKQFRTYYELLVEWNDRINLTAITEYQEVLWKHFIDSALFLNTDIVKNTNSASVLDLGTGAGFPGMVLAILLPDYQFTLVDSLRKRIDFLEKVVDQCNIKNVTLIHGRAEDLGQDPQYRNQYDFVVSRAVAELPLLLEYCIPFVKVNGYFVSYKAKKYEEEIQHAENAMSVLGAELFHVKHFKLRTEEENRYLVFIKNTMKTDKKYPRKAGKPKKKPL